MKELIIGTAQLGLTYGKTNISGKPSDELSREIIKYAIENNIKFFDTAREYGNSEQILSYVNKLTTNNTIITKLQKINYNNMKEDEIFIKIYESINTSCENLNIIVLPVLLLHNYEYYKNKIIWNKLLDIRNSGKIKNLGVSIYNVEEAIELLNDNDIKYLQLPVNIIDSQWNNETFINLLKKRKDIIIYARSIYLQGILLNNQQYWPENSNSKWYIDNLDFLTKKFNFNNKVDLCISYVKSLDWINGIIIGIETLEQLKENIILFNNVKLLNNDEMQYIKFLFYDTSKFVTDPRLW